jgi:spore germination protein GerM
MKVLRALLVVALAAVAAVVGYRLFSPPAQRADTLDVYYTKTDGETLARWDVSLSPKATDLQSRAFYATAQAVAGPAPDIEAIRFPAGTVVRSVRAAGDTVTVDLGGSIAAPQSGSFAESGEFKALVWTLTALPGITHVAVEVDGARVPTLPGGHLELDEALSRHSF